MLWLALLAQITAPAPENLGRLFSVDDLPPGEIEMDALSVVRYGVLVAPDGTAYDCRIEGTSGVRSLDQQTCSLVLQRARFRPARDAAGNPTYGVYRGHAAWWVGEGRPPGVATPDAEFEVNRLPAGIRSPALVNVTFSIDSTGRASNCVATPGEQKTQLASIACEQMVGKFTNTPATTPAGAATASIQNGSALFRTN